MRPRSKREQELRDRLEVLIAMTKEVIEELERVAALGDTPAVRRQRLRAVK